MFCRLLGLNRFLLMCPAPRLRFQFLPSTKQRVQMPRCDLGPLISALWYVRYCPTLPLALLRPSFYLFVNAGRNNLNAPVLWMQGISYTLCICLCFLVGTKFSVSCVVYCLMCGFLWFLVLPIIIFFCFRIIMNFFSEDSLRQTLLIYSIGVWSRRSSVGVPTRLRDGRPGLDSR
jgi:hypothetical protein